MRFQPVDLSFDPKIVLPNAIVCLFSLMLRPTIDCWVSPMLRPMIHLYATRDNEPLRFTDQHPDGKSRLLFRFRETLTEKDNQTPDPASKFTCKKFRNTVAAPRHPDRATVVATVLATTATGDGNRAKWSILPRLLRHFLAHVRDLLRGPLGRSNIRHTGSLHRLMSSVLVCLCFRTPSCSSRAGCCCGRSH